jgi:hypothetical protein
MSQSDSTMRPASDGATLSPARQSEMGMPGLSSVTPERILRAIWPTVRKAVSFPALMAIILTGVALYGVHDRLPDPDTWWHIAVGQRILSTHKFPTSDIYSFTAQGVHWIAYEWLGEIVMAMTAQAGGLVGLATLQMCMVASLTWLLYYYAYMRCGNWKASFVATGLLLPIATAIFSLRPQLFGYIFLLLTLICLEHFRQGHSRSLWILPPLFLLWVNVHGTFVFGLAAIGVYFASGLVKFEAAGLIAEPWTGRQRVQLLFTLFLSTAALLVTPYGSELAAYPLQMATMQPLNVASIKEWQPLSFSLFLGKYLLTFVLAIFVGHIFYPLKYRLHELAMLLFGVYAACAHLRFVLIFVMLIAPIAATFLAEWMQPYEADKDKYGLNLAIMVLLAIVAARFMPRRTELETVVAKDYPVAAVEYLRQHPMPTGMFNEYGFGGYLIWQLGPQHKVFIDGRADMYEYSGVFQDYMSIINLDLNALSLLRRYNIQSCLIGRRSALATLLAASPEWKPIYTDDLSEIFVRSRPDAFPGRQ